MNLSFFRKIILVSVLFLCFGISPLGAKAIVPVVTQSIIHPELAFDGSILHGPIPCGAGDLVFVALGLNIGGVRIPHWFFIPKVMLPRPNFVPRPHLIPPHIGQWIVGSVLPTPILCLSNSVPAFFVTEYSSGIYGNL